MSRKSIEVSVVIVVDATTPDQEVRERVGAAVGQITNSGETMVDVSVLSSRILIDEENTAYELYD